MTPPRCSHPSAPRSASSVYRLPAPFFGPLDPLTDSTSIASIQDHSNAVHGPLQPGFCREQHHLSAHSSCPAPWRCRQQMFHRAANMPGKDPNRDEKRVDRAPSAEGILQKDGKRHVRRWRHDREKPFGCDKNMLETENGADSCPNHGGVITLP